MVSFSAASLVAPYKFAGLTALSVLMVITTVDVIKRELKRLSNAKKN